MTGNEPSTPVEPGRADARIDVSVLVPVLNEEAHVRETVAAMQAQRFDGGVEFLFVDGSSTDGTRATLEELAERDARIRILDNPERRTPHALNIGLRAARGRFVARMDAHTRYPPTYLERGVERLERGGVEHVSGPQIARGAGRWSRRVALALSTPLGTGGARFRRLSAGEIEVDSGFAGVWRRATLLTHGGWDEGWPRNQDAELAARISKAGGRSVCLPALAASYIPRDSLGALARQYWQYGYYRAKTARRHPESVRSSHLLPPALALALVLGIGVRGRGAWAPRLGLGIYGLVLLVVSAAAAKAGRPGDAATLPAVFVAMHLAWGLGFVVGSVRFGPPLAAFPRLLGLGRRR